jgi:hypothetical protein
VHALQGTAELGSTYWLGLSWDGDDELWNWADGDDASNGEVLNAYPYAHWSYNFQDTRASSSSYQCVIAHLNYDYDK